MMTEAYLMITNQSRNFLMIPDNSVRYLIITDNPIVLTLKGNSDFSILSQVGLNLINF